MSFNSEGAAGCVRGAKGRASYRFPNRRIIDVYPDGVTWGDRDALQVGWVPNDSLPHRNFARGDVLEVI